MATTADIESAAYRHPKAPENDIPPPYEPVVGLGLAVVNRGIIAPTLLAVMAASATPREGQIPRRIVASAPDGSGKTKPGWEPIPTDHLPFLFDERHELSEGAKETLAKVVGKEAIGRAFSSGFTKGFSRTIAVPIDARGTRKNLVGLETEFKKLFEQALKDGKLVEARMARLDSQAPLGAAFAALKQQLVRPGEFIALRSKAETKK